MLVKPILPSVSVIDASIDNRISFVSIGGEQFTGFVYQIINNSTLETIVERPIISSSSIISLESNLLSNGNEYRLRVKTTRGSDSSEFSDYLILKCYAVPAITINNLILEDGVYKVKNQRYIFEGSYIQEQDVLLKGYYYVLYDSNGLLIKEYPLSYQQSGTLIQTIDILNSGNSYKIKLICVDQNDIVFSSETIEFRVEYIPPRIRQILSLKNNKNDASVEISCDVRQLIFNPVGEIIFTENGAIDLLNIDSYIYMDDSFTLNRDFGVQMWINDISSDVDILILKNPQTQGDNIFRLFYKSEDKRFHVIKMMGTIKMEYVSDIFEIINPFSLYIKQENGRVDIISDEL